MKHYRMPFTRKNVTPRRKAQDTNNRDLDKCDLST
jgi:hypothetical protein